MSSSTVILPIRRRRDFVDDEGVLSFSQREDEIRQIVLDWADQLATSETISSVSYADSGVTRSNVSNTTTTTTFGVTGTGETEVTVTLSTGRVLQRVVRVYEESGSMGSDYE